MGKVVRCVVLAALAVALSTPADATWWQARTGHFVLNVDDTEDNARDFALRLERFDAALRQLYDVPQNPDLLARPVTVYALRQSDYMIACGCPGTVGVYYPRTAGSFILSFYAPKVDQKAKVGALSSQAVLLHEYSHHFMFSNFPIAYPYWFSEGFAEFNANVTFETDGSLKMGYPANYRGQSLLDGSRISMKKLLSPDQYGFPDNPDLIYGRGWLLTHYLMLNPARSGQLAAYITAMNKGTPSYQAAQTAFGDLKKLDAELDTYMHGELSLLRVPPPKGTIEVKVTPMPEGVAAMLPLYASFRSGINKSYRLNIALKAAAIGRKCPGDAVVQAQLSEIELLATRLDRADAAADRALAIDPGNVGALVGKGRIAIARLYESKNNDAAAWTSARVWFLKANRTLPNAVPPLFYYYRSFVAAHAKPTPGAVKGLLRAEVLAPESREIGLLLARQELNDGDAATARALLEPLAFTPHYGLSENTLLMALQLIDAGKIDEAKVALAGKDDDEEL